MVGQFDRGHTLRGEIAVDPFDGSHALGSLFGHRVWQVAPTGGWLTGHYFTARWLPGENTALCLQARSSTSRQHHMNYGPLFVPGNASAYDFSGDVPQLREGFEAKECPGVARGDHGCGFYVRSNEPFRPGPFPIVRGAVEAWGQIELGDKGFRASKARIVALVRPSLDDETALEVEHRHNDIQHMTREVRRLARHLYGRGDIEEMEFLEKRVDTARKINERVTRPLRLWPQVAARYPDAEVFESEGQMLDAFPPTDLTGLLEEKP